MSAEITTEECPDTPTEIIVKGGPVWWLWWAVFGAIGLLSVSAVTLVILLYTCVPDLNSI